MEKWEISFVWRPPHSLPGMAFWEVREVRHWVTLDGGSQWFQTAGRELCRKGPMRSVHPQLGDQGFPLTRPELCFLRGSKRGWTGGRGRGGSWVGEPAKVTTSEIILSRYIQPHFVSVEGPIIFWKNIYIRKILCEMLAHLFAVYIASYSNGAHV